MGLVYLLETDLLINKTVRTALTQVFGLGKSNVLAICKKLGLCSNLEVKNITFHQQRKLAAILIQLNVKINSELKQIVNYHHSRLITSKSYRGLRKLKRFPVRGQRTRSNARTSKKVSAGLKI